MKICPVASSSKANMYVVAHDDQYIIIDVGLSGLQIHKQFTERLEGNYSQLKGIFISHAHSDHCGGLAALSKRLITHYKKNPSPPPFGVYTNPKLSLCLEEDFPELIFPVHTMKSAVEVGPFRVESITVPHDVPCLAFLITCGEEKLGICTDLGYIHDEVVEFFEGVQVMVMESNHDPDTLRNCSYPDDIKRRNFGEKGHLSNEDAAWATCELCEAGLKTVIFAHISQESNSIPLIEATFQEEMKAREKTYPCHVAFAPVKEPVAWYEVSTGAEVLL